MLVSASIRTGLRGALAPICPAMRKCFSADSTRASTPEDVFNSLSAEAKQTSDNFVQASQAHLEKISQEKLPKLRKALDPRERYANWLKLESELVAHAHKDWNVHWPGHVDKRTCFVDTDAILAAFRPWQKFKCLGYVAESDFDAAAWVEGQSKAAEAQHPEDAQLSPEGLLSKRYLATLNKAFV